ncbi:unnamed protein product [Ceratitis capitata]|uniref:(Mediterranean fruit fly) hypothetical protein n=1 Tax=Ceratitis capitata TaxID=7213 RepID=A0A811UEH7_CERCA|nr:unnamed protein product [Ceratitis capitata]
MSHSSKAVCVPDTCIPTMYEYIKRNEQHSRTNAHQVSKQPASIYTHTDIFMPAHFGE